MRLTGLYELRFMAGEHVLMPAGEALLSAAKPLVVDEVTAFVIGCLEDGPYEHDELLQKLLAEFDAPKDEAESGLAVIEDSLLAGKIAQ